MSDTRLFYTISEAADLLRCDPRTVSRGIEEKVIPAVRIGRTVRIPAAAFEAAMQLPPTLAGGTA